MVIDKHRGDEIKWSVKADARMVGKWQSKPKNKARPLLALPYREKRV